jgi:hypothetical protein
MLGRGQLSVARVKSKKLGITQGRGRAHLRERLYMPGILLVWVSLKGKVTKTQVCPLRFEVLVVDIKA